MEKFRVLFWVLGGLFTVLCVVFAPLAYVGMIFIALAIIGTVQHKKKKSRSENTVEVVAPTPAPSVTPIKESESPYIFLSFKVVGVTFNNGRKTRQAILRAFKFGDEDIETVNLEQYEYEGKPAVYVKINDKIVGNIPSDLVNTYLEYESKYSLDNIRCDVYGGNKLDDGTKTNLGCELTLRYKKS